MTRILMAQYARLSAGANMKLREGLEKLIDVTGGEWKWGTACSGSDVLFLSLNELCAAWHTRFGIAPNIRHKFSCESVDYTQIELQTCSPQPASSRM